MRTGKLRSALSTALLAALLHVPLAERGGALENSVVVESKTVLPDQDSVWVAIWLNNSDPVNSLYLPLEVRTAQLGAFPEGPTRLRSNPAGRLENSGLGSEDPECWPFPWMNPIVDRAGLPDSTNTCSGPVSHTYSTFGGDSQFESPDASLLVALGYCGSMPPGEDAKPPGSASIRILVKIPHVVGSIEFDTCCIQDAHIFYGVADTFVSPTFTRGVLTVCDCRCQGDPYCDSLNNVVDVVLTIERAFRAGPMTFDSLCIRHLSGTVDGRTDLDCTGTTDVIDVVKMIDQAFRGGQTNVCEACK